MHRNLSAVAVFLLVSFVSLPGVAQAPPSADAFVTNTQPAGNFGSSVLLPVQPGTTSYIQLNLAALPANASIAKATLRLYVNAVAAPGSFDVYQVNSGWSEKGISFNNAPSLGPSATGGHQVQVTTDSLNQFILIDITPLAQSWMNGSVPNYGIALALSSVIGSFSFDSKESSGTSHQPELIVVPAATSPLVSAYAPASPAATDGEKLVGQQTSDPYVDSGAASEVGNGSGLTGVTPGLSWPIVLKSADYAIQTSDFSTSTSDGKYLVLTGSAAHTFTLPNPAPPNGNCVAIGNHALAPIGSNINIFLTIAGNGRTIDGGAPNATQPGRNSYVFCSDGTNYWRLNKQLPGVSQIGPDLYTRDTGTVNALKTTFVAGLDFGLIAGTTIYLLPSNANTSGTPTFNVNGLGAKTIVRFGNHPLAPGDLSTAALAVVIYDGNNWQLVNPQTIAGTVKSVTATAPLVSSGGATPNISCPTCTTAGHSGTTGSIGGHSLTAGTCASGTAAVTGAAVGHPVSVSASDGSLPNGLIILSAAVTSPSTVTVQLCATGSVTPAANTYNVITQ